MSREQLLKQPPDYASGWVQVSRIHLSEKSKEEAVNTYRRGVELDRNCLRSDKALSRAGIPGDFCA